MRGWWGRMSGKGASRWSAAAPGLAAFAAVSLAMALGLSAGMFLPSALGLVTVAGCAALAGALASARHAPGTGRRPALAVLALGLAASWVHDLLFLPGVLVDPSRLGAFRPLLVAAGLLLLTYLWRGMPAWAGRIRYPAIVALGTALAATVILASPNPGIDVWEIQQRGAEGLLSGRNPYSLAYVNIYGPGTPFLDPALLTPDGRFITAYPYLPLVLLLDLPGAMLGDVRWTMLTALATSAILLRRLGKGSIEAELAGALLLLQPQGFMVLELAWTEPLALAGVFLVALTVTRAGPPAGWRTWFLTGLAAAFAVSTKQYVPLLAIPFVLLVPRGSRVRAVVVATAGAAALALPFMALDPRAFVRGILEFQLRQPFRTDALSWPAAIRALGGPTLPAWPAFLAAGGTLALSVRGKITPGRAMLAGAVSWIVFVAFNKQAFANYYWMAVGLLCASVVLLLAPEQNPEPVSQDRSR